MRDGLAAFSVIIFLLLAFIGVRQYELSSARYFAPQFEQLRNDTFHHSQAYTDGMKQQLAKSKYEFDTATNDNAKSAICALVRSDYAAFDPSDLSSTLSSFITTCNTWK